MLHQFFRVSCSQYRGGIRSYDRPERSTRSHARGTGRVAARAITRGGVAGTAHSHALSTGVVAGRAIARGGARGAGRGARGAGAVGGQPPSHGQPCAPEPLRKGAALRTRRGLSGARRSVGAARGPRGVAPQRQSAVPQPMPHWPGPAVRRRAARHARRPSRSPLAAARRTLAPRGILDGRAACVRRRVR
jgi:hypothetical protein